MWACLVGKKMSEMGLLESWWIEGEAVIFLRSACASGGCSSLALALALVCLGSTRTAGHRSCAALDDRSG